MKIYGYFKDNKMKFWSEVKQASSLEEKVITVDQNKLDKLKNNLDPYWDRGLKFEKEKPTVTEVKIDDIKQRVASGEDVKTLLPEILDLIKK